jgi:flagellar FliJ protein
MTQALHTLLELAERERDAALAALQQAAQVLRQLQTQAQQLQSYRDEYQDRHPARGGRSTTIDLLRSHQAFTLRLDQAIQQQQGQLLAAEGRAQTLRAALTAQELRVASVKKLLERRGVQARRHAARIEQRHSDEAAMQQQQRQRREAAGNSNGANAPGWHAGSEMTPLEH